MFGCGVNVNGSSGDTSNYFHCRSVMIMFMCSLLSSSLPTRKMSSLLAIACLLLITSFPKSSAAAARLMDGDAPEIGVEWNSTFFPGNCTQIKCPPVKSCPEDSYRFQPHVKDEARNAHQMKRSYALGPHQQLKCCPAIKSSKCKCIPDLLCAHKECPEGWVAHLESIATGKPGSCCPKFNCVPTSGDHENSNDYFPQSLRTAFDQDSSFDLSGLEEEKSTGGISDSDDEISTQKKVELFKDDSDFGKSHCFHNEKIHKSGESWTVHGECSECFCEDGLVSCKPISCNVPAECRLARTQPFSCCPVCDGCVSSTGKAYNMSETWLEDPCTNCTCRGGRIQCHTSACKGRLSCENPKYYPGECCPRCESEVSSSVQNPADKESCKFLECHRAISCPSGFRLDKSGCPTCECKHCQNLLDCKLSCSRGLDLNEFGCTICRCRMADQVHPLFSISPLSRNANNDGAQNPSEKRKSGFLPTVEQQSPLAKPSRSENDGTLQQIFRHRYHNGNEENHMNSNHQSKKGNEIGNHGKYGYEYGTPKEASPSVHPCAFDSNGVKRVEGEEWTDSCRRCVCRNGREMCSLITCPAPQCEHPIFYPGDCCPRCPDEEIYTSFHPVNVTICLSSDGTVRVDGETWTLSSCLTCTCHKGEVLCGAPECPPTPCPSPELVDCCYRCPDIRGKADEKNGLDNSNYLSKVESLTKSKSIKCFSDDSTKSYDDGDMWKVGACQSCRCESGQIKCFSVGKCPPVECSSPVLAKSQCCPICLENVLHNVAIQREHLHSNNSNLLNSSIEATPTTDPVAGSVLGTHCALLIACLLVITILLSIYILRQLCLHPRVSRRLIKKVPIGLSLSSSSSKSSSMTRDYCYRCNYSKCCGGDTGEHVVVATD